MNKQEIEKAIELLKWVMEEPEGRILSDRSKEMVYPLAISAITQQLNNGWIPVSERLPEERGYYLVTYHEWSNGNYLPEHDNTYVRRLRYIDCTNYVGWSYPKCCDERVEADMHREVLAWTELREPYKEAL
jgi:hypothetical protein